MAKEELKQGVNGTVKWFGLGLTAIALVVTVTLWIGSVSAKTDYCSEELIEHKINQIREVGEIKAHHNADVANIGTDIDSIEEDVESIRHDISAQRADIKGMHILLKERLPKKP